MNNKIRFIRASERKGKRSGTGFWFLFILSFLVLLVEFLSATIVGTGSDELLYITSVLTITYSGILFYLWSKETLSSFDPFTLFLLSMTLFLAGHQILHIFGLTDHIGGILYSIVSPKTTNMALLQILLCFVCFGFGAFIKLYRQSKDNTTSEKSSSGWEETVLRRIGWLMIMCSALPAAYYISHNIGKVAEGGYGAFMYQAGPRDALTSASRAISMFFLPGCLFVLAGSEKYRSQAIMAAICIACYSLPSFFLGERSRAIMPLLACAWMWHKVIWRIPMAVMAPIGIFLVFVAFPTIRIIRMEAGVNRSSFSSYIDAFKSVDNPFISILDEMGQSGLRIVAWVYDLIPTMQDYAYGMSYLRALKVLVPNLSGASEYGADSLSRWVVGIMEPKWAAQGGGYGFSFVGEAFYNFGWIGVVLISFLVGYFIAYLSIKSFKTDNKINMALIGCLLCIILFYPRAETRQVLREIIWYCLLPYSTVLVVKKVTMKPNDIKIQSIMGGNAE